MEIEFQSGEVYPYLNVPKTVLEELLGAESKGRHFNGEIRDDYAFVRVGARRTATTR